MNPFYPDRYEESVYAVDYAALRRRKIRVLLFDLDNTLELYTMKMPGKKITALMESLKAMGFQIMLLSNGKEAKVKRFCEVFGVSYLYRAGKPLPKGYRKAIHQLGVYDPRQCAVIGDQIFTDVLGANLSGMFSILVRPISRIVDESITKVKRIPEEWLLQRYLKKMRED